MAATHLMTGQDLEAQLVERWRFESLKRAGYDDEAATVLALSFDIDLHRAIELLESGCPRELALQILL